MSKFHPDLNAAVKDAKNRARTNYQTQFLYLSEEGYFIRSKPVQHFQWIAKVIFSGRVEYWPVAQKESEIQES